jgi:conjugal transfer pilus assembly protein TraF
MMARRVIQAALLMAAASAMASTAGAQSRDYYDRGDEGWFWYNEERVAEPEEPEEPEEMPVPVTRAEPPEPEPAEEPQGPEPLSTAWFEANLDNYLQQAIDEPTPQNVELYYRLQKIGLEKAQNFSEVAQQVVAQNPELDNMQARPSARNATLALERRAADNTRSVSAKVWESAGLAFFYKADCTTCMQQAVVLNNLRQRNDVDILAISLDGSAPPGPIADVEMRVDQGQAEMLDIESAPVLYLLRPPDEWVPIAGGMLSVEQVYERTLQVALAMDWITQEEFDSTRAVNRTRVATAMPEAPRDVADDPEQLLNELRMMNR